MYGNVDSTGQHDARHYVQDDLSSIYIDAIPDRDGQILYNRLVDLINRRGYPSDPAYTLQISRLSESERNLAISKNDNATRSQLRLATKLTLIDHKLDEIVLSRPISSVTSYNVLDSEFSTRVSEQAARENAINDLAQQIQTQLALFFRRKHTETSYAQ